MSIEIINNEVKIAYNQKKQYVPNVNLKEESLKKCIEFADEMAYGKGHHQSLAFGGGSYKRNQAQIFRDTLQGKIAEIGFYNFMYSLNQKPDQFPDFGVWGQGKWEDTDFTFNNGKVSVSIKSTKHFGNLLMLEKDRYNSNGEYIEPADPNSPPVLHNYIFLVRVKGIGSGSPKDYESVRNLSCEITGFISHDQFKEIINKNQFIPKGTKIGIPMIVDNYYETASNLQSPRNFKIK